MTKSKTVRNVHVNSIGNYTKGAVEKFEKGIINEKNYLEKVDKNLEDIRKG